MKLPDAENAVVPVEKLRDYCLDPEHPEGRHKARVFLSALGLAQEDHAILAECLVRAVVEEEAIEAGATPYGVRYTVDFQMSYRGKMAKIRSGWMVREGEGFPRLTSCYVDV